MSYTVAQLRTLIGNRKYPTCVLSEEDVQALADLVLMRLNVSAAVTKVGTFTAVAQQQDYLIFDGTDTTTNGVCQNAELILDVMWSSLGSINTADILNPGYVVSQDLLRQATYFTRPADMLMLRQKLSAWQTQFGQQGWKVLGRFGDPTSVLRLFNTPTADDIVVFITYTEGTDLTTLSNSELEAFWAWFEHYVADAMANYFSRTAGVQLLGFETKDAALRYWERKTAVTLEAALSKTHGIRGEAMRT